jgi:DNA-binding NarL/FixJ family response regulator
MTEVATAEPLRLLLVDDHPAFREGIRTLLAGVDDLRVIGEAADGVEAIRVADELQPDVVLLDLHMPGMNGIDVTRQMVQTSPHIAVLVLTMFEDDDSVFAAIRAGALGYLLKGANRNAIVHAVRAVGSGHAIYSPAIGSRIIRYFSQASPESPGAFPQLTGREREVLDLIAAGHNNGTIARTLSLSPKTVQNHISNIFSKLRVADRAQAIVLAREAGLGRS